MLEQYHSPFSAGRPGTSSGPEKAATTVSWSACPRRSWEGALSTILLPAHGHWSHWLFHQSWGGGTRRESKSLASAKASRVNGTIRPLVPQWLLSVRESHSRLSALGRVDGAIVGFSVEEWPDMGCTPLPSPCLSFFCTGECPLSACCFLCFFLGTGNDEQYQ